MDDPSRTPSEAELGELPLGAIVAFACWCAREAVRFAPITEASRNSIAAWLAVAEDVAENRLPATVDVLDHATVQAERSIEPIEEREGSKSALSACLRNAMGTAASVFNARKSGQPMRAVDHRAFAIRYAELACEILPVVAGNLARFRSLQVARNEVLAALRERGRREGWTDDSPVSVPD